MCEKSHTHTYQLKHIFILWHNGELQHALTAGHVRQKETRARIRLQRQHLYLWIVIAKIKIQ